ncbi:hypothetical protein FNF27_06350 [Cafeteria roenbergensis]|uniref:Uncharacterized protein n=1 Tax=Cafeteria roenbergensis TaxID=33653 RepID=A0A5A8E5J2_CAFRO|nr:hypothetical protein FNF27_06350 [Cafeteria roenbergensis]
MGRARHLRSVAALLASVAAAGARAGGNSGIVARALDARFGQWDGSQRVEVQVVDSIRHAGPHAVFVGRSGEAFQCSSEGPGTLRSVLPALVGDEAVANARSLVEEVLSRGCVNASRDFSPSLLSRGAGASVRVLRVCTDSVLEVLPSETNTRSLRSLGWHDPSLDNITMLDDGDVLYWRHYAARGTASKVAIAFGVGARWAKTLRAGNDLAAGKTMADAHAWNQVEVRAAEAPSTAGPASWEGMAVEDFFYGQCHLA